MIKDPKKYKIFPCEELSVPGIYWWFPLFHGTDPTKSTPQQWQTIAWHPLDPSRQGRSGWVVGPLTHPCDFVPVDTDTES